MADFLSRLAERTLSLSKAVRPRVAPLFAVGQDLAGQEHEDLLPDQEQPEGAQTPLAVAPLVQLLGDVQPERVQARVRPAAYVTRQAPMPPIPPAGDDETLTNEPSQPRSVSGDARERVRRPRQPEAVTPAASPEIPRSGRTLREEPGEQGAVGRRRDAAAQVLPAPLVALQPRPPPLRAVFEALPEAGGPSMAHEGRTVKVTIGRIDVRAVFPPTEAPRPAAEPAPSLSLEDYLKQRREGLR